ncbi:nucleoside 2-deoxyribosyltransferase [Microbacterium testaceum]|nr:nucleoside 2-deoxyribosyltransferase [Microbacterium testaceum]MCC4249327.1 nucleoside 2-deoxyribosyltransferase [Microbacterium testaceum]
MTPIVYLAGPEVFLPAGLELIERKRELARVHGFEPTQLPAEMLPVEAEDAYDRGVQISMLNERRMDMATVCIANLTPFRGISADVGTVYELGYMAAQRKAVFGYTNDPRPYRDRAADHYAASGPVEPDGEGVLRAPDGQKVEDHRMADNLMLDGGISLRGGRFVRAAVPAAWDDLTAFEACLEVARDALAGA